MLQIIQFRILYNIIITLGVKYRIADGGEHYGRVEISVGGTWGTICDSFWDEREASIFCRQMNFTDGEPVGRAHFGQGKGPIWLSHLECKGTEKKLHECPHRGFANEFSFDWWFPLPCETHSDDAGVFCYKSGNKVFVVGPCRLYIFCRFLFSIL